MKKYICILASAALLVACEQKTETVAPAASPAESTENNTTVVNPPATSPATTMETTENNTTVMTTPAESTPMETMTPATSEGSTMESTTTTEASPTP